MSATDIGIASRAGHIAKADLATQMVVEMTSLQGIIGREYALKSGYPQEVADVIAEHWLPQSADDALPSSDAGVLLALTDKLDSLVGLFAAGLAPKSTSDPFGLRRSALGVIQILVQREMDVNLISAIELVATAQPIPVNSSARTAGHGFHQRTVIGLAHRRNRCPTRCHQRGFGRTSQQSLSSGGWYQRTQPMGDRKITGNTPSTILPVVSASPAMRCNNTASIPMPLRSHKLVLCMMLINKWQTS